MKYLRIVTATLSFIAGSFLVVGMLTIDSDWTYLLAGFFFYLFAYSVWPSKKRGKRESDSPILDIIELIVEFPIEMIIWLVRLCGYALRGLFNGKGEGSDIDF